MIEEIGGAQSYAEVLDEATFLGPAEVRSRRGKRLKAQLPDGRTIEPEMALAWPTPVSEGDRVLVVGRESHFYVIGVLETKRSLKLRFFGDVLLHAVGGRVELQGDKEVELRAPDVAIRAQKFKTLAESVVERASTLYQNVREVLSVHAGEKREIVRGEWHARAERANIMASETVSVNGKEVHLG